MKIQQINITAFRGIGPTLPLILDSKNFLLYGENGRGKSSIVDAIEFALTQNVTSLKDKGQRVSFKRHCHNTNYGINDKCVEIKLKNGVFEYQVGTNQDTCSYDETLQNFLKIASDGTFILRRDMILNFINAKDTDRYRSISTFLKIEKYKKFEESLKSLRDNYKTKFDYINNELKASEASFRLNIKIPQEVSINEATLIEILNKEFAALNFEKITKYDDILNRINLIKSKLDEFGDYSKHNIISQFKQFFIEFTRLAERLIVYSEYIDAIDFYIKTKEKSKELIKEKVLTDGKKWIEEESLSICPLCEQDILTDQVLMRINQRLDNNKELIDAQQNLINKKTQLVNTIKDTLKEYDKVYTIWQQLKIEDSWLFESLKKWLNTLLEIIEENKDLKDKIDRYKSLSELLANFDMEGAKTITNEIITKIENNLPNKDKIQPLIALQQKSEFIKNNFNNWNNLKISYDKSEKQYEILEKLLNTAIDARKKACDEIFESISQDINDIYQDFHPDENLGNVTISMKEAGNGGSTISCSYYDCDSEDPRAYYSEAHLDTLGLAIFLALRLRISKEFPNMSLIVLDDVLTSVDAQHRNRIANYILNTFARKKGFQVIITTHDYIWFRWLINAQKNKSDFIVKEIKRWSKSEGPIISDQSKSDYEFIIQNKEKQEPKTLIPNTRNLLEDIICGLRYSLKLAIPAKINEEYTLGDIWPQFVKKCKKDYKPLWNVIEATCSRLDTILIMGNWLTHANEFAEEISSSEAMEFIDLCLMLHNKVYCSECDSFVIPSELLPDTISCKKTCMNITYANKDTIAEKADLLSEIMEKI